MSIKGFKFKNDPNTIHQVDYNYLDNLPFYEKTNPILTVFDKKDMVFTTEGYRLPAGWKACLFEEQMPEIPFFQENSKSFKVSIDGGELKAVDNLSIIENEYITIGNPKAIQTSSDADTYNDEFAVIYSYVAQRTYVLLKTEDNETHSIKVVCDCTEPITIIPKDTLFETDGGMISAILGDPGTIFDANVALNLAIKGKNPDEDILVTGITKEFIVEDSRGVLIGNGGLIIPDFEDTGENFLLVLFPNRATLNIFTTLSPNEDNTYLVSLEVLGGGEIKKLSPKFLDIKSPIGARGTGYMAEVHNITGNIDGGNVADGYASFAEGDSTSALGDCSHAEGLETIASSSKAHAEGYKTEASGEASHAEGRDTKAMNIAAHSEGADTVASGTCSHAEGSQTVSSGSSSHAEGWGTISNGQGTHTEGRYNIEDTEDKYAHIVGNGSPIERSNAYTLDWNGNAWYAGTVQARGFLDENGNPIGGGSGTQQLVEGFVYNLDDPNSKGLSANRNATPTAMGAWIEGKGASDTILYPDSEILSTPYLSVTKTVSGKTTTTTVQINVPFANLVSEEALSEYASMVNSKLEYFSVIFEDEPNTIYRLLKHNVSTGNNTLVFTFGFVDGQATFPTDTTIEARYISKFILHTQIGNYSHSEGYYTVAQGVISHAEGLETIASGDYSHAEGEYTTASGRCQHVQGKYNIEDTENKYAHIVGNGIDEDNYSNAHTLDWDGNAWYAGTIEAVNGVIIKSSTEGSTKRFKLTIDDGGVISATEIN
jgi:hypothetical protein